MGTNNDKFIQWHILKSALRDSSLVLRNDKEYFSQFESRLRNLMAHSNPEIRDHAAYLATHLVGEITKDHLYPYMHSKTSAAKVLLEPENFDSSSNDRLGSYKNAFRTPNTADPPENRSNQSDPARIVSSTIQMGTGVVRVQSTRAPASPPVAATKIAIFFTSNRFLDGFLGDLAEEYPTRAAFLGIRLAKIWYWKEIISVIVRLKFDRIIECIEKICSAIGKIFTVRLG